MVDDLITEALKNVSVCEVGRIVSVKDGMKSVDVQPMGKVQYGDSAPRDQPILRDVPIQYLDYGDYRMTIEPKAGSECILIFNNRNINNIRSESGLEVPETARMHDIQDAICLIGGLSTRSGKEVKKGITLENKDHFLNIEDGNFDIKCKKFTIDAEEEIVFKSAKTALIEAEAGVTLKAPIENTLDAPMTKITGSLVQGVASAVGRMGRAVAEAFTATFSGTMHTKGKITTDNEIVAQLKIESKTEVQAKTVLLTQHKHGGVIAGGAETEKPTK